MADAGQAARRSTWRTSTARTFQLPPCRISREDSRRFLDSAFRWDFERNGPSLFRVCRTTFQGGSGTRTSGPARARAFPSREPVASARVPGRALGHGAPADESNPRMAIQIGRCVRRWSRNPDGGRAASRILGPVLWWTSRREDERLARGNCDEPPTIIGRRNWVEASRSGIRAGFRCDVDRGALSGFLWSGVRRCGRAAAAQTDRCVQNGGDRDETAELQAR